MFAVANHMNFPTILLNFTLHSQNPAIVVCILPLTGAALWRVGRRAGAIEATAKQGVGGVAVEGGVAEGGVTMERA